MESKDQYIVVGPKWST